MFDANPNKAIEDDIPTHIDSDLKTNSTLKKEKRRHLSSNLTSTDDSSSNEESEFNISVTNERQIPNESFVSSPPKKMTDALISRWDFRDQF